MSQYYGGFFNYKCSKDDNSTYNQMIEMITGMGLKPNSAVPGVIEGL